VSVAAIDRAGGIVHHPRLCWEAARVFARAAASDDWSGWLADQLGRLFGPTYRRAVDESRLRLQRDYRPDALMAETGMWRVRLDDLLRAVPEAAVPLGALVDDVKILMAVR
jgi:hypothetical protein